MKTMKMKYVFVAIAAMLLGVAGLLAQTPEEIVNKMSEQMDRGDTEGLVLDFNMKIPVMGTVTSHNKILGKKMRMEMKSKDKVSIIWTDETTKRTYDKQTNELTIEAYTPSAGKTSESGNMETFEGIAEGYDLELQKETADAWYILCKKSKSNKDKDDPKKMELAVAKATYLPIYLKAKVSVINISFENVSLGVKEKDVAFNPDECPNAQIVDKRDM